MIFSKEEVMPIIKMAIEEDIPYNDITTENLISKKIYVEAEIVAKENCVLAGSYVARWVFVELGDYMSKFTELFRDGQSVAKGQRIAILRGDAQAILKAERTALNFLSRLSGIATLTEKFVKIAAPYNVKIMDTRKTTPGLRFLERYAVRVGGGINHRLNLSEEVLIKENHIDIICEAGKMNPKKVIKELVSEAKNKTKNRTIEIEVRNMDEFRAALDAEPDIIMFDNMEPKIIKEAVSLRNKLSKQILVEASGGINLENARNFAKTGVDILSVGMLTHSAPAIDFSLNIVKIIPKPKRKR